MTGREIPAGARLWRVTSAAGQRIVRPRQGGDPVAVPENSFAEQVSDAVADEFTRPAPAGLLEVWRLAEAQQPRYGWQVWRLGADPGWPAGWVLLVSLPDGNEQRYIWARRPGGAMEPVGSAEATPPAGAAMAG